MLLSLARVGVGLRVKAVVDNVYTSVVLQKSSQEVAVSGVTLSEKKKKISLGERRVTGPRMRSRTFAFCCSPWDPSVCM